MKKIYFSSLIVACFNLFNCSSNSEKTEITMNQPKTTETTDSTKSAVIIQNQKIVFFKEGATQANKDSVLTFIETEYAKKFGKTINIIPKASQFNPLLMLIVEDRIDELPIENPNQSIVCNNLDLPIPIINLAVCNECPEDSVQYMRSSSLKPARMSKRSAKNSKIKSNLVPTNESIALITSKMADSSIIIYKGFAINPIATCPKNCCKCRVVGGNNWKNLTLQNTNNTINLFEYLSAHYIYKNNVNIKSVIDALGFGWNDGCPTQFIERVYSDLNKSNILLLK